MSILWYEHPLNEKVRIYLRLESLFKPLMAVSHSSNHETLPLFFHTLFDVLEILEQNQVKTELLKDLNKQRKQLSQWLDIEGVDHAALQGVLTELTQAYQQLSNSPRLGQSLKEDRFLSTIRQRFSIPGGCCSFDLPNYHHWLHLPEQQKKDIQRWVKPLAPLYQAIKIWLQLRRDLGKMANLQAHNGFFQSQLKAGDFLRLGICPENGIYPMISGLKSRVSIRFLPFDDQQTVSDALDFQLTLC